VIRAADFLSSSVFHIRVNSAFPSTVAHRTALTRRCCSCSHHDLQLTPFAATATLATPHQRDGTTRSAVNPEIFALRRNTIACLTVIHHWYGSAGASSANPSQTW